MVFTVYLEQFPYADFTEEERDVLYQKVIEDEELKMRPFLPESMDPFIQAVRSQTKSQFHADDVADSRTMGICSY